MAVASLKLLLLQSQSILHHGPSGTDIGVHSASVLFKRLKGHVISLACGSPVLGGVQTAAQATLQQAWRLLLPAPQERATALHNLLLAALLQRGEECGANGRRFMADLLVTSLMAAGGLEAALEASLLAEAVDADGGDWDDKKEWQHLQPPTFELVSQRAIDDAANKAKLVSTEDFGESGARPPGAVPLPQLVKQLLKNCSQQSLAAMRTVEGSLSPEESIPPASDPGICLLLQFPPPPISSSSNFLLLQFPSPPTPPQTSDPLSNWIETDSTTLMSRFATLTYFGTF